MDWGNKIESQIKNKFFWIRNSKAIKLTISINKKILKLKKIAED